MSRTRSTPLERSVITLLGGFNWFKGIPTLALGPGMVHARCFRQCLVISSNGLKPDVVQIISELLYSSLDYSGSLSGQNIFNHTRV